MVNTKSDIPDEGRIDITAKVKHTTRPKISKRAWELKLEDIDGSSFQLILTLGDTLHRWIEVIR